MSAGGAAKPTDTDKDVEKGNMQVGVGREKASEDMAIQRSHVEISWRSLNYICLPGYLPTVHLHHTVQYEGLEWKIPVIPFFKCDT